VLRAKTGLDVVRDVVGKKLMLARVQLDDLQSYEEQNREESTRIQQDIQRGRSEVKRLAGELFNELQAIEAQLLGKLRPLSMEDIRVYLEEEVGYTEDSTGYKLNLKIKTVIDRFFAQSSAVTNRISLDISSQLDSSASFLETMGSKALGTASTALKGVSKLQPAVIKQTIFAARDVLGNMTGMVVKFKPWEATKLAGSISKWAGPAGAAIQVGTDLFQAYKAHELEQELQQVKSDIGDFIKGAFKNIYDLLSSDEQIYEFFAPQLKEFEKVVRDMKQSADGIRTGRNKVEAIQHRLQNLALEKPGERTDTALTS
jgi:hypothetical protein